METTLSTMNKCIANAPTLEISKRLRSVDVSRLNYDGRMEVVSLLRKIEDFKITQNTSIAHDIETLVNRLYIGAYSAR